MTIQEYDPGDGFYHFKEFTCEETGMILREISCVYGTIHNTYELIKNKEKYNIPIEVFEICKELIK